MYTMHITLTSRAQIYVAIKIQNKLFVYIMCIIRKPGQYNRVIWLTNIKSYNNIIYHHIIIIIHNILYTSARFISLYIIYYNIYGLGRYTTVGPVASKVL